MKYGYKEIRKIEPHALRKLCIKNDWYTNGTNEEYAKLFDMIKKDNITTDDIVEIASDIYEHSSNIEFDEFTDVMYQIAEISYTFFEEV